MTHPVNEHILALTDNAVKEIEQLKLSEGHSEQKPLRIGVKGGGCSGLSYVLEFDDKGESDMELDIKGVKVIVDQRHALYISGMEVDYEYGLNDRGFIFKNPNASSTCGCGTSFAT